ncbi:hypothetical protein [Actinomadura macra]|uniref:hypothetical protein n=1 Tax=Actinomadura macra TaxID=46164 RepID=UPI00082DFF12|nr:hypothetical protein [Actinomadura macra]
MASERPDTAAPAAGPSTGPAARQAAGRRSGGVPAPTADERAKAAGTAEPGAAGDTHVAGPPPPAGDAPEPVPDTAPDPLPTAGARRGGAPARGKPPASDDPPSSARPPTHGEAHTPGERPGQLLDAAEADRFRERWHVVQAGFVDDPAASVRAADELAAEAAEAIGHALTARRRALSARRKDDGGRDRSDDTERLRLALRDYRTLLDRIVSC